MKQKSDIERGWEFSSRILGASVGANIGANYVAAVNAEIDTFTQSMLSLQSRSASSDASLSGFVAEYWHAGTFNVNAVAAGSSHRATVVGSTEYGSVDIGTNFGKDYGSKYYSTPEKSVVAQAEYSRELGKPKFEGQEKLIPTDQLAEGKKVAHRKGLSNEGTRPKVAESYYETERTLTDRITDGEGVESDTLTKEESMKQAREIKDGEYSAENNGVSTENAIKAEYIVKGAVKAGLSTAMITMVIQLAPDIYKAIDYLIKHKEIDVQQLKNMGKKAIKSGADGFLRGSISYALFVLCKAGKLGEAMKAADPTMIGCTVAIVLETIKNAIAVAVGKMTAREMGSAFVDSVVTTAGFVAGMSIGSKIGGVIGQAIGLELPVLGYILGSLVGCAFSVAYNYGKRKLISFCVDTGFTCFGLVEQDYTLPQEILEEMGIDIIPVSRTNITRSEIQTTTVQTSVGRTNYETIDIRLVRRGVIGINKIGYVY